jgi:thiamine-phosphate pyrophosphorylase
LSVPAAPTGRWALGDRRLYLCTSDRGDLESFVEACIEGGVDIVQLREKQLPDEQLVERAALVRRVCADHHIPFILNDRPDLAAAIGADGVHVGQQDVAAAVARRIMGEQATIGLSTHAPIELATAIGAPAPVDYISAGPVTPTPTKPGRAGTGLGYVREAVSWAPWPVWVTGGVDPTTVANMVAAGARHFVVVRWLTEAPDPAGAARVLRQTIDELISRSGGGG